MGQNQTKTKNSSSSTNSSKAETMMTTDDNAVLPSTPVEEYQLKKRRPGCTGMFWRSDPTGKTPLASNNDWPRDDALLRGQVVHAKGEKWLLVQEVKQAGKGQWKKTPAGAAMPFEYDDHYYLGNP
jgi:hypothetical protein